MSMELKQQMKLAQQLVMTPALQQAIKLLQLSRLELVTKIQEELEENPVLEEQAEPVEGAQDAEQSEEPAQPEETQATTLEDKNTLKADSAEDLRDVDWEAYLNSITEGWSSAPSNKETPEDLPSVEATLSRGATLYDHLVWQLKLSPLTDTERKLGEEIIGNLDEDGYLRNSTTGELAQRLGTSSHAVEKVLDIVQHFDPLGVGARDLRECLKIQARVLAPNSPELLKIIENHLLEVQRRDFKKISKSLGISIADVAAAVKVLSGFDPKPGRAYGGESPHYIVPDVYVRKVGGEYIVELNEEGLPKLRISEFYRRAIQERKYRGETKDYVQERLRSATWLVKSIYQRQRTIYRVTESIVKKQIDFLDHGVGHLKPMILRDVAEDVGVHESTISRVTTNKYVHTPQGMFELKYFFNTGIRRTDGDDIAAESVKDKIKQLVAGENPKKPLSDQKIAAELDRRWGIQLARRTVAKYREALKLPSSAQRRRIY
ncbi:MAG: RNA polymerase factor sigma-54 [Deltaproteobacteria bacterium]|nr:RNA polymerase factor sigma-54 [Deltaproteobacteria bacterium]